MVKVDGVPLRVQITDNTHLPGIPLGRDYCVEDVEQMSDGRRRYSFFANNQLTRAYGNEVELLTTELFEEHDQRDENYKENYGSW